MNDMLGFEGTQVPDVPGLPGFPEFGTPGRNKWIWNLAKGVQMRFENHNYFGPGAPACETEPHWQIRVNGKNIGKWMPGDPIP
ncbi:MAG TPA: hypothetical protein VK716_03360 [Terracidiphilus sp.]|jgi:hypothetical protein|nr:hypothetical protein [Terracidiphilus sp.]